jgi:hypothetical protein
MGWVPLALLGCCVGLLFLLYMDPPSTTRGLVIPIIALAGAIVLGILCLVLLDYVGRVAPIVTFLIVIVLVIAAFFTGRPRTRMPDVTFGLVMLAMGAGWIAYALYRHLVPEKPWLQLSPSGIALRITAKALIPWHEVKGVESRFHYANSPYHFAEVTTVLISSEFYERHILPQRTIMRERFWENMFLPKSVRSIEEPGALKMAASMLVDTGSFVDHETPKDVTIGNPGTLIQIALSHMLFRVEAKDIREPIEARWKAFRDRRGSVPPSGVATAPTTKAAPALVYGRWSWKLSPWRAALLLVPLAGLLAIVTNLVGIWDTQALRAAREERMAKAQKLEADRRAWERTREELSKSVKIGR